MKVLTILLVWTIVLSANPANAKQNSSQDTNPKVSEPASVQTPAADDNLLFEDDFENPNQLGKNYSIGKGMEDGWVINEGVLIGKQIRDDHGSVIRKELDFKDIEFNFDFRFNGGSRFNFVIDDEQERSVHAGHICRVSISPKRLTIGDDKTGAMNLAVQAQRKDKSLSAEKKKALDELLAATQSSAAVKLQENQWYHLRISIQGDLMEAYLDGTNMASLRSPGIDHPAKTKFGMTVNGSTIDFDNLKVSAAAGK